MYIDQKPEQPVLCATTILMYIDQKPEQPVLCAIKIQPIDVPKRMVTCEQFFVKIHSIHVLDIQIL